MAKQYTPEDVDAYLNGQMSDSDRRGFENEMQSNAQLVEEVETFRAEKAVFQLMEKDAIVQQLEAWDKDQGEDGEGKKNTPYGTRIWFGLGIPLSLLLLLVVIYFCSIPASPPPPDSKKETPLEMPPPLEEEKQPQEESPFIPPPSENAVAPPPIAQIDYKALAATYYAEAPFTNQLRTGATSTDTSDYQRARQLYVENNFSEALVFLNTPDSTRLKQYLYLRAHTFYQLGEYRAAQEDFAAFQNFRFSDRKKDAAWGEILSLLQQMPATREQLDATLEAFINQNASSVYLEKAVKLLATLRSSN